MGTHKDNLAESARDADQVIWYEPSNLTWGLKDAIGDTPNQCVLGSVEAILEHLKTHAQAGDAVVIMSNGGFEGIHGRLIQVLGE